MLLILPIPNFHVSNLVVVRPFLDCPTQPYHFVSNTDNSFIHSFIHSFFHTFMHSDASLFGSYLFKFVLLMFIVLLFNGKNINNWLKVVQLNTNNWRTSLICITMKLVTILFIVWEKTRIRFGLNFLKSIKLMIWITSCSVLDGNTFHLKYK